MDWVSRAAEYTRLVDLASHRRRERAGAAAVSDIAQQLSDFEGAAAAALTGSADEARFFIEALEAPDGAVHELAIRVLIRRRQFPRLYVEPVVRAGVTRGQHGHRYMVAASSAWGPTVALTVLIEALDSDQLTSDRAAYLAYYVVERKWAKDRTPEAERRSAHEAFERALARARQRERDRGVHATSAMVSR